MNKVPIYNFVIIGRSGTGKSSLINHFFNEKIAEVGQGKPVTGKEFEKFNLRDTNLETNIYDSWGIEGGKTQEWLNYFNDFSNKCKTENISDWIHTAVYCISGESKRLENFEKEVIDQLIKEELNPVIVITKSDLDLENVFLKSVKKVYPNLSVVPICNVEKQIGLGNKKTISSKFGLEELKENVLKSSLKSFEKRFLHIVEEMTTNAKKDAVNYLIDDVDQVLSRIPTNWIGNISYERMQDIEIKIIERVNIYNRKVEGSILNLYNQATQIYGEFLLNGKSSLPIMRSRKFRMKENNRFIDIFMNSILNEKNPVGATIPLEMFHFPSAFTFRSSKFLSSIKGVDKNTLSISILRELVKYYDKIVIVRY